MPDIEGDRAGWVGPGERIYSLGSLDACTVHASFESVSEFVSWVYSALSLLSDARLEYPLDDPSLYPERPDEGYAPPRAEVTAECVLCGSVDAPWTWSEAGDRVCDDLDACRERMLS